MAAYDDPELLPIASRLNEPGFAELARARGGDGYSRLGSSLASLFLGGNARALRSQMIEQRAAGQAGETQLALDKARAFRDQQLAIDQAADRFDAAGDHDLAAFFRANRDPHQIGEYRIDQQKLRGYNGAFDAADAGDDTALNRDLAIIHGQPFDVAKAEGGVIVNPHASALSQAFTPTAVGESTIGANKALAGERAAQARAADARAAKTAASPVDAGFGGDVGNLLGAFAEAGIQLPAGFRSKEQMRATLQSLIDRNPGIAPEDIVQKVAGGQLDFGASKKETTTAAGQAGKVSIAGHEIDQFAPLIREASAAVPRSSFIPINKLLQTADTQLSDPNLLRLKIGINSMLNAYDQLAARGGTDVNKRAEAHALLSSAQSPEALAAGIAMFQNEAAAAARAAETAMKGSRSRLSNAFNDGDKAASAPQQTQTLDGKTYVKIDGKWYPQP